jgi:hypothetical protein
MAIPRDSIVRAIVRDGSGSVSRCTLIGSSALSLQLDTVDTLNLWAHGENIHAARA